MIEFFTLARRPYELDTDDEQVWRLKTWDDELGIWLTLAQANVQDEAMAQGIPVLRGPYTVDWSDIPHEGDKRTLWTPAVGDVLLRFFADWRPGHVTQWDHGALYVGQNPDGAATLNYFAAAGAGGIGTGASGLGGLDNILEAAQAENADGSGANFWSTVYVFHTTDPVQIELARTGGTDPTTGHVELYALVARAVAP